MKKTFHYVSIFPEKYLLCIGIYVDLQINPETNALLNLKSFYILPCKHGTPFYDISLEGLTYHGRKVLNELLLSWAPEMSHFESGSCQYVICSLVRLLETYLTTVPLADPNNNVKSWSGLMETKLLVNNCPVHLAHLVLTMPVILQKLYPANKHRANGSGRVWYETMGVHVSWMFGTAYFCTL